MLIILLDDELLTVPLNLLYAKYIHLFHSFAFKVELSLQQPILLINYNPTAIFLKARYDY